MSSLVKIKAEEVVNIRDDLRKYKETAEPLSYIIKVATDRWLTAPIKGWFLTKPRHSRIDTFALWLDSLFISSADLDGEVRSNLTKFVWFNRNLDCLENIIEEYERGTGKPIAFAEAGIIDGLYLTSDMYRYVKRLYQFRSWLDDDFIKSQKVYWDNYDYVANKRHDRFFND